MNHRGMILMLSFLFLAGGFISGRERRIDAQSVDITEPNIQVIPMDVLKQMGSQEQSLRDIERRLGVIENTLGQLQGNIQTLMSTNVEVNFVMGGVKLLVPGLLITAFGVWLSHYLKRPRKRTT